MRKDIFIDTNVASRFSNPQDKEYIKLTTWLMSYNQEDRENKNKYAHLVVSKKLLAEYYRSSMSAKSDTSIPIILNKLITEDRLIVISNDRIKAFKKSHYTKSIIKKFRSNKDDREHLPVVFLSDRKYALSYDDNFTHDLLRFPGFSVFVRKRPEELPYK